MSNVGAELKKAREAQEKTRADVARETGIFIHHLAALEHGNFADLPDDDTVAGFVRAYAEYLGFVPEEPVAEFWAERRAATSAPEVPTRASEPSGRDDPARRKPPAWIWIAAGAAIVAVVVVAWVVRGGADDGAGATAADEPTAVATPSDTGADDVGTPSTPEPEPDHRPTRRTEPAIPAPAPSETSAPATESAAAPPDATTRLKISEHGVGTGVRDRRLVGESDRFAPGTEVWFWTRVVGGRPGDAIDHVWIHEDREVATVSLAVGSSNWRTQSAKTMYDGSAGRWAVEARDPAGHVLARSEFRCGR